MARVPISLKIGYPSGPHLKKVGPHGTWPQCFPNFVIGYMDMTLLLKKLHLFHRCLTIRRRDRSFRRCTTLSSRCSPSRASRCRSPLTHTSSSQFHTGISAPGLESWSCKTIISDAGECQNHGEVGLAYLSGTVIS